MSPIELMALGAALLFVLSITWSTVALGISPMPSSRKARRAILSLTENTGLGPIYELGSGWGNLLFPLAKMHPQREVIGYELSLLPWLVSLSLCKVWGLQNVTLYRRNFLQADLRHASLVVCYLYPGGMRKIEDKLADQSLAPQYLISHYFSLPSYRAARSKTLGDLYQSPVYLYRFGL